MTQDDIANLCDRLDEFVNALIDKSSLDLRAHVDQTDDRTIQVVF